MIVPPGNHTNQIRTEIMIIRLFTFKESFTVNTHSDRAKCVYKLFDPEELMKKTNTKEKWELLVQRRQSVDDPLMTFKGWGRGGGGDDEILAWKYFIRV